MRKLLLILAILLIGSSCKKVYQIEWPNIGNPTVVEPLPNQIVLTTKEEITSRDWIVDAQYAYNVNTIRTTKFVSGQYTVIVKNMPSELFWSEAFKKGKVVQGTIVWNLYLWIKHSKMGSSSLLVKN